MLRVSCPNIHKVEKSLRVRTSALARQTKSERRPFVEEVLAKKKSIGRSKNKYSEIQAFQTSGRKAHYKRSKEKRSGGIRKP